MTRLVQLRLLQAEFPGRPMGWHVLQCYQTDRAKRMALELKNQLDREQKSK